MDGASVLVSRAEVRHYENEESDIRGFPGNAANASGGEYRLVRNTNVKSDYGPVLRPLDLEDFSRDKWGEPPMVAVGNLEQCAYLDRQGLRFFNPPGRLRSRELHGALRGTGGGYWRRPRHAERHEPLIADGAYSGVRGDDGTAPGAGIDCAPCGLAACGERYGHGEENEQDKSGLVHFKSFHCGKELGAGIEKAQIIVVKPIGY